jgi:hypothetical protein
MADAEGSKIVDFAKGKQFTSEGTGECFDLADNAIKSIGAKSAGAYGEIKPDADYVWGTEVAIGATSPGDILQYKDYVVDITLDMTYSVNFPDGSGVDYGDIDKTKSYKRPHHTAIATTGVVDNQVRVIEQNVERAGSATKEKKVDYGSNYTTAPADSTVDSEVSITVSPEWGKKAKGGYNDAARNAQIDGIVAKYNGQSFTAKLSTTTIIAVSGTIKAYRVQK